MIEIDALNESNAKLIISELVKSSVRHFLISPGSRSTPITLAVSENPLAKSIVHFDERGLAFTGLGIAKGSENPSCLICTSGTALANFYPAIIEASTSYTPLLILSSDRPTELRDVGANQSIDQVKIFGSYLRWEIDLLISDPNLPKEFLARAINQACFRAKNSPAGPVLINLMIREPLYTPGKRKIPKEAESPLPQTCYILTERTLREDDSLIIANNLARHEKGIIIVGDLSEYQNLESIYTLAMKLQWPIFADSLSGMRSGGRDSSLIPFYNHLLQVTYSSERLIPDAVLYLGGQIVSKTLSKWLKTFAPEKFYHVANFPERHDPTHQVTDRIEMHPTDFCQNVSFFLKGRKMSVWLGLWKEYSLQIEEILRSFFEDSIQLSEPHTLFSLLNESTELYSFFFSASLPIRYADTFFFPEKPSAQIFSNRGASGIDGIIATSIGVAIGSEKPLIAFIGDLAFLHDINSLALAKNLNLPIIFIVLNNSGGGLFHFLPISENRKFMDTFISAKHSLKMEEFARAFGIPYSNPNSLSGYQITLKIALENPTLQIIEVKTNADDNYLFHEQIESYIRKRMSKGKKAGQLYTTASRG